MAENRLERMKASLSSAASPEDPEEEVKMEMGEKAQTEEGSRAIEVHMRLG